MSEDTGTHTGIELRYDLMVEMTIVLQHQFSDLAITDDAFALTLSFAEVPARLTIPFAAVVAFADPSVQFGLQFTHSAEDSEEEEPEKLDTETQKNGPAEVVSLDSFRKK